MRHEEASQAEAPTIPANVLADLLRIGGTNDYGEPKLRLVWGGTHQWFRADKWRLAYPIARKLRRLAAWNITYLPTGRKFNLPAGPQPVFSAQYLVAPVWEDREIGYPGWILEEWWPPEVVCPGWEAARWEMMPDGKKLDLLGPEPVRGQFRFLLYLDDGNEENPTPLELNDHRIVEIVERAVYLRQKQSGADGWRGIQSVEKAKQLQEIIQKDRDRVTEEEEREFENFLKDIISDGYAAKMRAAYLS